MVRGAAIVITPECIEQGTTEAVKFLVGAIVGWIAKHIHARRKG